MVHGFTFRLPADSTIVGKTLSVTARVDVGATKRASFKVTSLMMKAPPPEAPTAPPPASAPPTGTPPAGAPPALIVWVYEGARAEVHGEQRAPVGAMLTDDVFGACELRGKVEGRLLLRVDGEERERTAGHVALPADPPPTAPTSPPPPSHAPPVNAPLAHVPPPANAPPAHAPPAHVPPPTHAPPQAPLSDAEIAQRLTALECEWADGRQTTLAGTANTDVDALHALLDAMGAEAVELRVPDRAYTFARSRYGARALCITSHAPDGEDFGLDEAAANGGIDGGGVDGGDVDGGVPLPEVPYAAANLQVPPGGESAVAEADQQLQIADQLQERGAQAALADGYAEAAVEAETEPEAVAVAEVDEGAEAAEVAEVVVAEVTEARSRKRRKTPEERVAEAAAKEATARAKAEEKAAAKTMREEETRRKAAERVTAREAAAAAAAMRSCGNLFD